MQVVTFIAKFWKTAADSDVIKVTQGSDQATLFDFLDNFPVKCTA